MQKIFIIILALSLTALLTVPDSWIGEYKGIITAKYFLREQAIRAKNILISLAKGERPKEFDNIKPDNILESIKQEIKDTLKESAKEAIDEL
jgi:hypothetical protein